jgi:DNA-binding response OmpR family regulator
MDKDIRKIVIIDKDALYRERIALLLQQRNFDVSTISDIRNSYPKVEEIKPDLIIMGISKPRVYYYAFAKNLIESEWGKYIPLIILVDGEDSIDEISSALQNAPYKSIMKKPRIIDELVDRIIAQFDKSPVNATINEQETLEFEVKKQEIELEEIKNEVIEKEKEPEIEDDIPINSDNDIGYSSQNESKSGENKLELDFESSTQIKIKKKKRKSVLLQYNRFLIYAGLFLLFLVLLPLFYLKFQPFMLNEESIKILKQTANDEKAGIKKKESSLDVLKALKISFEEIEKRGLGVYIPEEYSKIKIMITEIEALIGDPKYSKRDLEKRLADAKIYLESLMSRIDLSKSEEKEKALSALSEVETLLKMIRESKMNITPEFHIQESLKGYIKAKEIIKSENPDYAMVFKLASETADNLMKTQEYNIIKLTDDKKIQLREKADYYFELELYVFPENNNALHFYQELLKLHPTNQHALKRIEEITRIIKEKADRFYKEGNYSGAKVHYIEYLKLVPNDDLARQKVVKIIATKKEKTSFWSLASNINPLFWIFVVVFVFILYRYLPVMIDDLKNVLILLGVIIVFLILLMIFS